MKKFYIILLIIPSLLFAQSNNENEFKFYDLIGKRVYVNKEVTSYNFSVKKFSNKVEISNKDYVDFKNPIPSKIIIQSNEEKVSIRVNSRYYKEDLYFEYSRIYKVPNDDGTFYYDFVGKNPCTSAYFVPQKGKNQSLYIKCTDNMADSQELWFTISQFEEL